MFFRIASLALSVCALALPASATDYPDHAIKMIVPFAAGGGTDVLARIIAQNLNSKWGQPVVVENQPGASGGIGTRAVMKAPPDGYTLLMASTGALMAVSGSADADGPFDVSAREIQQREVASGSRFWTAKNMPGFAPLGPYILTMDEVADTDNLWVTCDVNGKRRLRANTGDYLYKIADVLEHFSRHVVFEPGDLIAMGAPSGVAVGQPNAAELYLQPGDDMVISFEGLMSLRTRIVAPAGASGK